MAGQFSGFLDADFDAYQQRKWSSNAFNLERLQVRQKLEALGRELQPQLTNEDGSLLAAEVNAEHPAVWNQRRVESQYLFFSRNAEARRELDGIISQKRSMASMIEDPSPLRNHAFLAVRIDEHGVQAAFCVHSDAAVDRENFERKCEDFFQREKILATLTALPDDYYAGLAGSTELEVAAQLKDETLVEISRAVRAADTWFTVCRSWARDEGLLQEPQFSQVLADSLAELLPVLHQISWGRSNDFLSMREQLRDQQQKQVSRGLSKADKVRIVRGMFSGKIGVVQEADAKGGLKVLVGKMSVKLSGEDVRPM